MRACKQLTTMPNRRASPTKPEKFTKKVLQTPSTSSVGGNHLARSSSAHPGVHVTLRDPVFDLKAKIFADALSSPHKQCGWIMTSFRLPSASWTSRSETTWHVAGQLSPCARKTRQLQ